jgi:hypothetical protein
MAVPMPLTPTEREVLTLWSGRMAVTSSVVRVGLLERPGKSTMNLYMALY